MIKAAFQNSSPFAKLIFTFFIMVLSFTAVFLIGLLIALPFTDISLAELPSVYNDLSNESNILFLKYIQGLNTTGLFIIPPFIIAFLMGQKVAKYLNLNLRNSAVTVFLIIVIMLAALPLINFLAEINSKFHLPEFLNGLEQKMKNAEDNAEYVTEMFVNVNTFSGYLINMIVIAILPAIGEELIFRGVFQKLFINWTKNIHLGILLAAVLFSAFHFQFFGFIPRMLMGVFFGYLLIWSKSIWIPIIAHFVNNAIAVTFYYLYNIKVVNVDIENIGAENNIFTTVLLSCIMVISLVYYVYFIEKKKNKAGFQ